MKPLNRSERSHTFLRFLFLFLVTVALIVTVVFFSVEVPLKEAEQMRSKMFAMEKEKELSDSFSVVMREAVEDLRKFDSQKDESALKISLNVDIKIDRMTEMIKRIPNGENSIYNLIRENIDDLNKAKTTISKLKQ